MPDGPGIPDGEQPIWGTVREIVSCELVDELGELAPREYITMRPSHDISHPDTYCTGKR
jgi:hypothetical protein